jgi:nucleotide-binding universal stress UspA family protein
MSGIIVGVDGSGHSSRALDWAVNETALLQVPLTVVTVREAVAGVSGPGPCPEDQFLATRARETVREQVTWRPRLSADEIVSLVAPAIEQYLR